MRLLFIFLSTFVASTVILLLVIYVGITIRPYPTGAGVDERGLAYILLPGMNMMLTLASITIFLNFIEKIREEGLYSFLSFFASPIIFVIYLSFSRSGSFPIYAIVLGPFFCVLTLNFVLYRKHVKSKSLDKDVSR